MRLKTILGSNLLFLGALGVLAARSLCLVAAAFRHFARNSTAQPGILFFKCKKFLTGDVVLLELVMSV
jgi:hypothetical protein